MECQSYGLAISCDDLSAGLTSASNKGADIHIQCVLSRRPFPSPSNWFMHWYLPGGDIWSSFAKLDEGYLIQFHELAQFFISDQGREIIYCPGIDTPPETIQHLLLNQVIPLVINLKGGEALHASAVVTPRGVVAFLGPTGSGKSTLAGSFLLAGCSVLSDDCLTLKGKNEGIFVMPAYPGLRLWEDSFSRLFGGKSAHESVAHYTTKRRIDIERKQDVYGGEGQALKRLYVIADRSESEGKADIVMERPCPRDSFMALVRCAFRLDITDRNMLSRQFRFLERVVSKVPVRKLIYPRDFKFLPAVREAILKDLQI